MAHFLEHMVFKGTEELGSGEFERRGSEALLQCRQPGLHPVLHHNGPQRCRPGTAKIDVVLNCLIPDEAFERERLVIIEAARKIIPAAPFNGQCR